MRLRALAPLALALLAGHPALADDQLQALSHTLDALFRADTSQGVMAMTVVTPDYERTLKMSVATRGLDDTLVRILEPHKERGISTLKKGTEMWNYLPRIKKVMRIPPSMMMGSWMGSDFTNDDLVRGSSWEADYTATLAPDLPADAPCIVYVPRPQAAVTWSKVEACFAGSPALPVRLDYFDEKGRKARTMTFEAIKELGGRRIPTKTTLVPLLKPGHRTVMEYLEMTYDAPLPPNTFSQAALRRDL
ncbi:MAG: outer membrane lipoprotein-sorting protein [Myxococcales bacterium]|nr:outer membrane lipoprotein-sorting protein [Myxococcales bacterium]